MPVLEKLVVARTCVEAGRFHMFKSIRESFEMSIFGEKYLDIFEKESQRIFLVERLVKSRMPDRSKRRFWGIHG